MNLFLLVDHKEFYGTDKTIDDALELLKDIPSSTLLNYISGFSVNLYLNENNEHWGKIQAYLIDSLISKAGSETRNKWKSVLQHQVGKGHSPIIIWAYSNLLFYSLIFKTFNNLPSRDLTSEEAKKVFDVYLILNSIANNKIQIDEKEITEAAKGNKIEDVVMPAFIYQKDYASSTDFTNQVTRGVMFFEYLENSPKYSTLVKEYYAKNHTTGFLRMFKNLSVLFTEIKIGGDLELRSQLANLKEYFVGGEIDLKYIDTLCINKIIPTYVEDVSFSQLRSRILFKLNEFQYLILNVNFLLDKFYKAQVFEFYSFLKSKGIKDDFLSIKGKEFMEDIYLKRIITACFPPYIKFFGDKALTSSNTEMCDVYFRESRKIGLVEFKDVLLNSAAKNNADAEKLFGEFDKKFLENQTKKPKGITQLLNAIRDIENNSVAFDKEIPDSGLEIFPIIIYTDLSFGVEGLNKIFKAKFNSELENMALKKIKVHDITFINLNFFELWEDYLSRGILNIFHMIELYQQHTDDPEYHLTPFEVFSRFYMEKNVTQNLGLPKHYHDTLARIVQAK